MCKITVANLILVGYLCKIIEANTILVGYMYEITAAFLIPVDYMCEITVLAKLNWIFSFHQFVKLCCDT